MPEKKRLLAYLKKNNIDYVLSEHPKAYTAQRAAAEAHISGKKFLKTIVVKIDGKLALAVLPANDRVGFDEFAKQLHARKVELASEEEFRNQFPDSETGGMPPFGNLYGMDTYISSDIVDSDQIAFNACNHVDMVTMKFEDFNRLVNPIVVPFEIP